MFKCPNCPTVEMMAPVGSIEGDKIVLECSVCRTTIWIDVDQQIKRCREILAEIKDDLARISDKDKEFLKFVIDMRRPSTSWIDDFFGDVNDHLKTAKENKNDDGDDI